MSTPIYRYKFSDEFISALKAFIDIHRYDIPEVFKEKWKDWCTNNSGIRDRETRRLKEAGYTGAVDVKMYKSARYYYKNKSMEETKSKKRRKYIRLGADILGLMDTHLRENQQKPSLSYIQFIDNNKQCIKDSHQMLLAAGLLKEDIDLKIRKTFKNRYFRFVTK